MGLGPALTEAPTHVCSHCPGHVPHHPLEPKLATLSEAHRRLGSDYKGPSPGWGKPYRTHKRTADRPFAICQVPVSLPGFLHRVSSELRPPPLGCSQRPVGGVGKAARFCSMAGSIPEEGTGRGAPGWGPGEGSRAGSGKRVLGLSPVKGSRVGSRARISGAWSRAGPLRMKAASW